MIVEFVEFRHPPGWTREQVLEDARHTVEKWRANEDLVRKHFIAGEGDMVGGIYVWKTRQAADRAHDAEWLDAVEKRTGTRPTLRYFDLTMVMDNVAGTVTEFGGGATEEMQ